MARVTALVAGASALAGLLAAGPAQAAMAPRATHRADLVANTTGLGLISHGSVARTPARTTATKATTAAAKPRAKPKPKPKPVVHLTPVEQNELDARQMLGDYHWRQSQFGCLAKLWTQESGWSTSAENSMSGAYGIAQALPGSKMATAGKDWRTNPKTQIRWGLDYIQGRYDSPCGAWGHETADGWY
jgi:hypothetical protein